MANYVTLLQDDTLKISSFDQAGLVSKQEKIIINIY